MIVVIKSCVLKPGKSFGGANSLVAMHLQLGLSGEITKQLQRANIAWLRLGFVYEITLAQNWDNSEQ